MDWQIAGLSEKPFRDIGNALLAHCSILGEDEIPLVYVGRKFFGHNHFENPGVAGQEYWSQLHPILIEMGMTIMVGRDAHPSSGVTPEMWSYFFAHQIGAWTLIINKLWAGGHRLVRILEGPPEFTPSAYHLKQIDPPWHLSDRFARYLKEATGLDATGAVEAASKIIPSRIRPVDTPFPRTRNLDKKVRIRD